MGQLKPSEVRLLILFGATVLLLGTYFLYEWYSRALLELNAEKAQLEIDQRGLYARASAQDEYNVKRVWLNENQPIAHDEFEAKEALDRVVSVRGIEAAGLTLVSSPPEKEPTLEPNYWAFERRIIVEGDIQGIVRWLTTLQSETAFRAITQLHIFPKKQKEPEILTCEVAIEQRYATAEIVSRTNTVVLPADPGAGAGGPAPGDEENPEPLEGAPDADSAAAGDTDPEASAERRVVVPSVSRPSEDGEELPEVTRPRIRLPEPSKSDVAPPATGAEGEEEEAQSGVDVGTGSGLLAKARRQRISRAPQAPPPMASDLQRAEQIASERGVDPVPVETGVVPVDESEVDPDLIVPLEPTVIPILPDEEPTAPQMPSTYDSVSVDSIVGEDWDANTAGASAEGDMVLDEMELEMGQEGDPLIEGDWDPETTD